MAGTTSAKSKVKNGADNTGSAISKAKIDEFLLNLHQVEENVDNLIQTLDSLGLKVNDIDSRVGKVESRLGLG